GRGLARGALDRARRSSAAGLNPAYRAQQRHSRPGCRGPAGLRHRLRPEPLQCIQRDDDALIDELAAAGIAYMPYFPLGGLRLLESATLSAVAVRVRATPTQVAL